MKLMILKASMTFFASAIIYANLASAAPFAIKDIELGMPPDAYPTLGVERDCSVWGYGTLLQCYERENGVDGHGLDIRTTIAGETCRVNTLEFANLARPSQKADWTSFSVVFICEGYQSTFDNLRRALENKFGAPDRLQTSFVETMPWLYWYDGAFELTLWNPPPNFDDPPEVLVFVKDEDLEQERKKLELRLRNEDI